MSISKELLTLQMTLLFPCAWSKQSKNPLKMEAESSFKMLAHMHEAETY
jgi:hypothetical protein